MKNILLIEDDSKVIRQVASALESDEFNLDVAETASQGYELALKNVPNLVICSWDIYDGFGYDVLRRLRDETFIATIPFIFLLDKKSSKAKKGGSLFSFEYFIIKPFSSPELIKIIQLAFEKYETWLKNSEKRLDDLRGSISFSLPHEFFTPLNGILGFSEILIKDFDHLNKPEMIQMLKYINKDAIRLKKLTENFLAFAQLDMIGKDPEKVSLLRKSYYYNPRDIIISTAKQLAQELERDEDLLLEVEDAPLRMGEGYVKKLAYELIDNSFKFSEKGTPVIVTLMSNDNSVLFHVSDSGRGMTPEQIISVGGYMQFDRQLHEQQGSGLGLIIAKKIVELHGGQFKIESLLNEGTKVSIICDI
jgi:signal transduction histidine kinase